MFTAKLAVDQIEFQLIRNTVSIDKWLGHQLLDEVERRILNAKGTFALRATQADRSVESVCQKKKQKKTGYNAITTLTGWREIVTSHRDSESKLDKIAPKPPIKLLLWPLTLIANIVIWLRTSSCADRSTNSQVWKALCNRDSKKEPKYWPD